MTDEDLHDLPDDAPGAEDRAAPTPLSGIGAALRRLRMHRGLRQYEAAETAGITKAMLSAYETGKRRPSLKTLDSLLKAMGSNLGDLHVAMMEARRSGGRYGSGGRGGVREVREAPRPARGLTEEGHGGLGWAPAQPDLYRLLGIEGPLPPEEERALEEMLRGFLKLLRFMHRNLEGGRRAGGWGGGPYGD